MKGEHPSSKYKFSIPTHHQEQGSQDRNIMPTFTGHGTNVSGQFTQAYIMTSMLSSNKFLLF